MADPDQVEEFGRLLEVPDDRGEFAGPLELLTGLTALLDLGMVDRLTHPVVMRQVECG